MSNPVDAHSLTSAAGNKGQLEGLLASMVQLAEDGSDPTSQKTVFTFLGRCVSVWAQPITDAASQAQALPGFERFVYERLIPAAFALFSSPQFNIADGQTVMVRLIPSRVLVVDTDREHRLFTKSATSFRQS